MKYIQIADHLIEHLGEQHDPRELQVCLSNSRCDAIGYMAVRPGDSADRGNNDDPDMIDLALAQLYVGEAIYEDDADPSYPSYRVWPVYYHRTEDTYEGEFAGLLVDQCDGVVLYPDVAHGWFEPYLYPDQSRAEEIEVVTPWLALAGVMGFAK